METLKIAKLVDEHNNKLADVIIFGYVDRESLFKSTKVVVRWMNEPKSTVIWDSLEDFRKVNLRDDSNRTLIYFS